MTTRKERPWLVLKFGGTSVSSAESWRTIETTVRSRLADGYRLVVVHSALSGVSNQLESLLEESLDGQHEKMLDQIISVHCELGASLDIDAEPLLKDYFAELRQLVAGIALIGEVSPRLHARVMSVGELMATRIGAQYLKTMGVDAEWVDARTILQSESTGDSTERGRYLAAVCHYEPDEALQQELGANSGVVLTQGFIAGGAGGHTVLLGRGGSDTSASYLAARLQASRLEIWTDVPGMFSANPHSVPAARLLRLLSYNEALEIATSGGKVLHPRCIPPVRRYRIPISIHWTSRPEHQGTLISASPGDGGPRVKAISMKTGLTLVSMETMGMWQQVGFLADVFQVFRRYGISIDLVSTSETNVTVSLDPAANVLERDILDRLVHDLGSFCRAKVIRACAAVSLVGRHIRAILHELGPALELFEEQRIHLVSQAANDLNFTFVVDQDQAHRLMQQLHDLLIKRVGDDEILGPTWEMLKAPEAGSAIVEAQWWQRKRDRLIDIAHSESSAYVYDRDTLDEALQDIVSVNAVDRVLYAIKANNHPEVLQRVYEAGLGFECVSPGEVDLVLQLFPQLDRKRILFTPNFAPRSEYEYGVATGVWLTLDNVYPLQHWPELFRDTEVFIRIDPGQGHGHHKHVRTAGRLSKFGVPLYELDELEALVAEAGVRVIGLHCHSGSGILNPSNWQDTATVLAKVADRFPEVRFLDLGGGLGVPDSTKQERLDLDALGESLGTVKAAHPRFELWLEPGRFLIARAGVLVTRVTQTKGKGEVRYVGVATGMNSLIRPALYGAYHEIINLSRLDEPARETVNIVGPICETGDKLGVDRLMPISHEGDVIAVANAGAYGYVMSSHYNLRPPAKEVVI